MKKQRQADMLLLTYALIMGITSIILKQVTQTLAIYNFMAYRFLCAFLVSLMLFWRRCHTAFSSTLLKHAIIVGIVTYLAHLTCTTGIAITPVGIAGFLTSLQTIVVPIIGFVFLHQNIATKTVLCVVTAFLGVFLISVGNLEYSGGVWLCLASSVLAGLQIILIERYVKQGDDGSAIMIVELGTMALCAILVAFCTDGLAAPKGGFGWFSVLWMGIISTAIATFIQNYAQKNTTAVRTGIIFSTIPVFTLIGSRLFFQESFSVRAWCGAALLIVSVITIELGDMKNGKQNIDRKGDT